LKGPEPYLIPYGLGIPIAKQGGTAEWPFVPDDGRKAFALIEEMRPPHEGVGPRLGCGPAPS